MYLRQLPRPPVEPNSPCALAEGVLGSCCKAKAAIIVTEAPKSCRGAHKNDHRCRLCVHLPLTAEVRKFAYIPYPGLPMGIVYAWYQYERELNNRHIFIMIIYRYLYYRPYRFTFWACSSVYPRVDILHQSTRYLGYDTRNDQRIWPKPHDVRRVDPCTVRRLRSWGRCERCPSSHRLSSGGYHFVPQTSTDT